MPNLKVLQDQPEQLKSQLYGFDGSSVRPLLTDNTGRTDIRPLDTSTDSVTVIATDLNIRDLSNTTDNILVYGNDGTNNQLIRTNASGQTDIRPLTTADQVTVIATDLNIRDLSNTTDNILVYGNDGTSNQLIRTNASGQTDIRPLTAADQVTVSATDLDIRDLNSATDSITAIVSVNHTESGPTAVTTTNTFSGTGQDIATWRTFSFFVANASSTAVSATIKIQISPDNTTWVDDGAEYTLAQNEATVLVTSRYLRYARVAYQSAVADTPADLSITFQAQS